MFVINVHGHFSSFALNISHDYWGYYDLYVQVVFSYQNNHPCLLVIYVLLPLKFQSEI